MDALMLLRDMQAELEERLQTVKRHKGYAEKDPNSTEYAYQQGKQEAYEDIVELLSFYFEKVER